MASEISQKLAELRKLERQAKQLIYKMDRLEKSWNDVAKELREHGKEISHRFGDTLYGWRKKTSS
jgi:hypothetical protein